MEDILKSAAVKQEEILFANRPSTPPMQESRTWSIPSKRSRELDGQGGSSIRLDQLRPTIPRLTSSDALRLAQRKRKTASILSDQGSGPAAVRHKAALVVYYDGDTQKRFENVVRAIGLSRNAIRKGKMSAKVDSLSRTGSSSSEGSGCSSGEDSGKPRLNYKSSRPSPLPSFGRNDGTEVYDDVDSQMEKAQGFCERAAYQVLKDGDCTPEITHAKQHFAQALKMTEAELPALKKKAEKALERQRKSEERRRAEEEVEARRTATALALKARLQSAMTVDPVVSSQNSLEVDQLEADESDSGSESDGEFNVADLQFGKLSQVRGARIAAIH